MDMDGIQPSTTPLDLSIRLASAPVVGGGLSLTAAVRGVTAQDTTTTITITANQIGLPPIDFVPFRTGKGDPQATGWSRVIRAPSRVCSPRACVQRSIKLLSRKADCDWTLNVNN